MLTVHLNPCFVPILQLKLSAVLGFPTCIPRARIPTTIQRPLSARPGQSTVLRLMPTNTYLNFDPIDGGPTGGGGMVFWGRNADGLGWFRGGYLVVHGGHGLARGDPQRPQLALVHVGQAGRELAAACITVGDVALRVGWGER